MRDGTVDLVANRRPNESIGLGFDLRTGTQSSGTGGTATASYVRIGQGSWGAGPNLATSSGTLTLTTASANRVVEHSVRAGQHFQHTRSASVAERTHRHQILFRPLQGEALGDFGRSSLRPIIVPW